jgi:hypothetical protein
MNSRGVGGAFMILIVHVSSRSLQLKAGRDLR